MCSCNDCQIGCSDNCVDEFCVRKSGRAKFIVCPECEGEGYLGTLGDYTPGEFWDAFDDAQEYLEMHEASKQACAFCKGQRVVTQDKNAEYQDYLEYEAERNAERRAGC